MEILEAYDLTGTLRGAAALAGCDHKTVARLVAARRRRVVGCRCGLVVGHWCTRLRRRSMSWWTAHVRACGRMLCTECWWRWAMRGRIGRPGGRSRRGDLTVTSGEK